MKEKSILGLLMVLPKLLKMKHLHKMNKTTLKQWGLINTILILLKTLKKSIFTKKTNERSSPGSGKFIANLLISMWEVFGDREAIISEDKRFTYNEFKDRTFRLANGLQSLGLKPKDKFAELLYNGNEFFEALFAGSLIGCPMPFLNWHMKGDELAEAINRVSPRVLLLEKTLIHEIQSIRDKLTTIEYIIIVGGHAPDEMISYEHLISRSSNQMPDINFILAISPYTGGTTGAPKNVNYFDGYGYAISNISEPPRVSFGEYLKLLFMQFSFVSWFKGSKIKDPITHNMRCLIPGPLYHAGVIVGWAPFMLLGGTGIPMKRFDPIEFLSIIERERINWVFVVPTMLDRILALPDDIKNKSDLSSMRSLICAAAPASPELKKATNDFFKQQGCKENIFMEYYGSAETSIVTILQTKDYEEKPERYSSVGKARCGEIGIFNEKKNQWCPPDKEGKVLSRTVMTVSLKYTGSPEKLEKAFKEIDGVSWFDDGLLGYLDKDHFLYLTGREKEMIISGGVNLYPNEIEAAIKKNQGVFDVAVVRYPDKDLGEIPAAVIQPKEGVELLKDEIIDHCKAEGLHGHKLPKIIEFTKELPRHEDGKLLKRLLEDKFWEGIKRRG